MGRVTTQKAIKELKIIKKDLKKQIKIERMILFGSRAKNKELLSSDVDVIVISSDFSDIPFRKRPDPFLDKWKMPVDLEILCYSPEEIKIKSRELGLVQEALKTGKDI